MTDSFLIKFEWKYKLDPQLVGEVLPLPCSICGYSMQGLGIAIISAGQSDSTYVIWQCPRCGNHDFSKRKLG